MLLSSMIEQKTELAIFRKNLVSYRKARGYSQQQLAQRSGLSQRMIAYYENQVSNPPINNVLALAKALDVSVAELVGEEKTKHEPFAADLDPRTLRKIMQIGKLPRSERATIYNTLDALLRKYEAQEQAK